MPKEYIESAWFGQYADVVVDEQTGATEKHLIENTALKVGWSRDCHVELAIVDCKDGSFETGSFEAQHMQLDRAGINRIIRTLRRARDAAFGSDA